MLYKYKMLERRNGREDLQNLTKKEIAQELEEVRITGAHLFPFSLQDDLKGDGYCVLSKKAIAIIDVSLPPGARMDQTSKPIAQSRILQAIQEQLVENEETEPEDILSKIINFNPSFMRDFSTLDWGFSITAVAFDQEKGFYIASLGTNNAAVESPSRHDVFNPVIAPHTKFFSPNPRGKSGSNAISIRHATIPPGKNLLIATRGITVQRKGLLGCEKQINLNQPPEKLLDAYRREGLYLKIMPKLN